LENRIAQLEAQGRGLQGALDRAVSKLESLGAQPPTDPTPAPPAAGSALTEARMMELLRRQREIDTAEGALKEQFPNATTTLSDLSKFESFEAMRVAAENEEKAFQDKAASAIDAAVADALKPYIDKHGPIQVPPAGAAPGAGDGLPTLAEVNRMSLDELDALEEAHPGLHKRLLNESLTT